MAEKSKQQKVRFLLLTGRKSLTEMCSMTGPHRDEAAWMWPLSLRFKGHHAEGLGWKTIMGEGVSPSKHPPNCLLDSDEYSNTLPPTRHCLCPQGTLDLHPHYSRHGDGRLQQCNTRLLTGWKWNTGLLAASFKLVVCLCIRGRRRRRRKKVWSQISLTVFLSGTVRADEEWAHLENPVIFCFFVPSGVSTLPVLRPI